MDMRRFCNWQFGNFYAKRKHSENHLRNFLLSIIIENNRCLVIVSETAGKTERTFRAFLCESNKKEGNPHYEALEN